MLNSTGLKTFDRAGWIGHGRKIRVGRRLQPALDLAGADLGDVGGVDRIGAVGGARVAGRKPTEARPKWPLPRRLRCALPLIPMAKC